MDQLKETAFAYSPPQASPPAGGLSFVAGGVGQLVDGHLRVVEGGEDLF